MSKLISLTRGQSAIVDDHWFERLSRYSWCCSGGGYAYAQIKNRCVYMHRMIAATPTGLETDHINRNRLDNQEHNLRNVTRAVNLQNRAPYRHKTRLHVAPTGRRNPPKTMGPKRPKAGRPPREGSIIKIRIPNHILNTYFPALQKQYPSADRSVLLGIALEAAAKLNLLIEEPQS